MSIPFTTDPRKGGDSVTLTTPGLDLGNVISLQLIAANSMITFKTESGQFNLRVAGVAMSQGCILLHQIAGDSFWTLPGGRPEIMETASEALRREMLEETGLSVEIGRALCVAENFFAYRATPFHEILLCVEMSLPVSEEAPNRRFHGSGDNAHLTFWWCPLGVLDTVPVQPAFLRDFLKAVPATLVHVVQDDRPREGA